MSAPDQAETRVQRLRRLADALILAQANHTRVCMDEHATVPMLSDARKEYDAAMRAWADELHKREEAPQSDPDPAPRCDICGSSQFMGSLCIPCHDDHSPHREPPGEGGEETAKEASDA